VGKPEEIIKAISYGIDMFDCVIPTREARHGRIYKFSAKGGSASGRKTQNSKSFYGILNITNARFKKDFKATDENCGCYTCQNFSRAYLNHLFKMKELLGYRLATIHNLYFYLEVARRAADF
jgi:queuine tRNA-ribosyltransferase